MKFTIIAAALLATATSSFAAGNGWLTNLEEAQVQAAAQNKPILIEFTGSDWCPPCKMLNKNVFATETFNSKAPEKFILVEMDFPQNKEGLTPEIQKYRQDIATKYDIKGYPSIILTDSTGQPLARTGFKSGDADSYLAHLDEILADSVKSKADLKAAHALKGEAKAKALIAIIKDKSSTEISSFHQKEIDAIKAADPADSTGFIKGIEDRTSLEELLVSMTMLAQNEDWDGAQKLIETFSAQENLTPTTKQEALGYKASILFKLKKNEETLATLTEAIAIDPSSQKSSSLKAFKAHVEKQQASE